MAARCRQRPGSWASALRACTSGRDALTCTVCRAWSTTGPRQKAIHSGPHREEDYRGGRAGPSRPPSLTDLFDRGLAGPPGSRTRGRRDSTHGALLRHPSGRCAVADEPHHANVRRRPSQGIEVLPAQFPSGRADGTLDGPACWCGLCRERRCAGAVDRPGLCGWQVGGTEGRIAPE